MIPRSLSALLLCLLLLAPSAMAKVVSPLTLEEGPPSLVSPCLVVGLQGSSLMSTPKANSPTIVDMPSDGNEPAKGCFDVDVKPIKDGVYGVYALVSGTLTLYKPNGYMEMSSSTQNPVSLWGTPIHVAIHVNATWDGPCRETHEDEHVIIDNVQDQESSSDVPTSAFCPGTETDPALGAANALRNAAAGVADRAPEIAAALREVADAMAPPLAAPVDAPAGLAAPAAPDLSELPPVPAAAFAAPQVPATPEIPAAPDPRLDVGGDADALASPAEATLAWAAAARVSTPLGDAAAGEQGSAAVPALIEAALPAPHAWSARAPDARVALPVTHGGAQDRHAAPTGPAIANARTPHAADPAPPDARAMASAASPSAAPPLAAIAAATLGAGMLLGLALALYQRLARHKALDHPARQRLHDACLARAGAGSATAGELAAATGMARKSAEHHLRALARVGLLREDAGPPRRYAAPTAPRPSVEAPLDPRVDAMLASRPGVLASEIADALGVGYGRVDRRLKELLLAGLVESRVEAGRRRYFLRASSPQA